MNLKTKIESAVSIGYKCDVENGIVYGLKNQELKSIGSSGYKVISFTYNNKSYMIYQHQFIFYCKHNLVVSCIDHIDGDKLNNKIENLRSVTKQQNGFNTKSKGAYKLKGKFMSQIVLNRKSIYLGLFDTEDEAHQAYLNAKKIYHNI
jgi:hypothetical protein